jgi:hypothetical protein
MLRSIMADSQGLFDLLFQLLEMGGAVTSRVWALLLRLPTNGQVKATLWGLPEGLGSPSWDVLLSPRAPARLLYALQIVETLLEEGTTHPADLCVEVLEGASAAPPLTTPCPTEALAWRRHWRHVFLSSGGFAHVLGLVTGSNLVEDSWKSGASTVLGDDAGVRKGCIAAALKILRFFIFGASMSMLPHLDAIFGLWPFASQDSAWDSETASVDFTASSGPGTRRVEDIWDLTNELAEWSSLSQDICDPIDFRQLQVRTAVCAEAWSWDPKSRLPPPLTILLLRGAAGAAMLV